MNRRDSKYFFHIKGLLVPKGCDNDLVQRSIDLYIEAVPQLCASLENTFRNQRYDMFVMNMEMAHRLLRSIYARALEGEARVILRGFEYERQAQVQDKIRPFIAALAELAEEIKREQDPANYDSSSKPAWVENSAPQEPDVIVENEPEPRVILTVDDRPEILSGICNMLKDRYKVYGVTSGEAALRFLDNKKADLILLDIDMPGMDGFEFSASIRTCAKHANTPIIFLTGSSSREHVVNAMCAGGNDYIVKPAKRALLLAKIEGCLDGVG